MKKKNGFYKSNDFFKKNERDQNAVVMRLFYYTPFAGIAMVIGSYAGAFNYKPFIYFMMTGLLLLQSILMKVFCTVNPEHPGIKYYIIITTGIAVFVLSITEGFEPFMIYAIAPLLSCLYFNRKFCLFSSVLSYIVMIISIVVRSLPQFLFLEGLPPLQWGVEYGIGLTLEFILNIGILYLLTLRHLDVISSNLEAINTFQTTQDELITGYSDLIYQAHQSRKVNIKRLQCVVGRICEMLNEHEEYPELQDGDIVKAIISAVPLHDIGLISVNDAIVSKQTTYTDEEKKEYQTHVVHGEELIRKNFYLSENREFLKIARDSALYHHEHWDGSGYPEKLMGTAIPVCARIIAAADELELRVSGDNEHQAVTFDVALTQIQSLSGTILDPVVVEAMLSSRISLEKAYSTQVIQPSA